MNILRSGRVLFLGVIVAVLGGCGTPPFSPSTEPSRIATEQTRSSGTYEVLHIFSGPPGDGSVPLASLIKSKGTLYGTTERGGAKNNGTVFAISPSGDETVLHSFKSSAGDGALPQAPLFDLDNALYGTTIYMSQKHLGTVFGVTPSGTEAILHEFGAFGNGDGTYPRSGVVALNGTLYGTTTEGGAHGGSACPGGCGVIFSLTRSGTETVLHSFGASGDGVHPFAGLVSVNGTLYGTTLEGGASNDGTVFAIAASGAENVLHSFSGAPNDGSGLIAGLINVKGTLFGATHAGGTNDTGVVFSITTSGKETVLYNFGPKNSSDGANPDAPLVSVKGTLYGTTHAGGGGSGCQNSSSVSGCGTVFAVSRSGAEHVLHSFQGGSDDGAYPQGGLVDVNGTLYGTTSHGGTYGYGAHVKALTGSQKKYGFGTVFAIRPRTAATTVVPRRSSA